MKMRKAAAFSAGMLLAASLAAQVSAQEPPSAPINLPTLNQIMDRPLGYVRDDEEISDLNAAPEDAEQPALAPVTTPIAEPAPRASSPRLILNGQDENQTQSVSVQEIRAAYDAVRSGTMIVYEEGQKIAWRGDLACVLRQTGWKPWSSGERGISEAVSFCEDMESGQGSPSQETRESSDNIRIGMDNGRISVVESIGSGEGWFLERKMLCGADGLPISTLINGEAQNGNRTVTIRTGRAYSAQDAIAAEKACIEAARQAM